MLAVAPAAILVAGCQGSSVELSWTGADTGAVILPATATRCGAGPVELVAMSGDTGIGIVIHGAVPLEPGRYPLTGPNEAASSPPAAALAARWPDSTDLYAWRSMDGSLELSSGGKLGGTFAGRAERWGGGTGEIEITGTLAGIRVGPCPAEAPPGDSAAAMR